ncbi:MAG: pseudouridine synthase [Pseudomonadota bacterium]|nr:pseudouridine synthase [Pseudomonadota bacterium]
MRINKYLSERGLCSRREADLWIEHGRVSINGAVATLGTKVQAGDVVRVDGRRVGGETAHVYIALHKPVGVECTTDPRVPHNVIEFVSHHERIFPIGRLDKNSEGLLLLTNDGDIVNGLLRARHGHEKEYIVTVDRPIDEAFLNAMAGGIEILDRVTAPCRVFRVSKNVFRIILTQGLNRQIRRMCEVLDYTVRRLVRVRFVNIRLEGLAPGQWRNLTPTELAELLPERFARRHPAPMVKKR